MNATIAVIWDMDGVLVNTGNFHYKAWRVTLDEHGIPFSFDTFRKTFGMNNEGILRFLLGESYTHERYIEISDQKEATFRDAIKDLGIEDQVKVLRMGFSHPLPSKLIKGYLKDCDKVLVVEEGEPYMEEAVKAMAQEESLFLKIKGKAKDLFSRLYEYNPGQVRQNIATFFDISYR